MGHRSKGVASFLRDVADAGVFFPAANVCNFMQGQNPAATEIAITNVVYSSLLVGGGSVLKRLPDESRAKHLSRKIVGAIHDTSPTRNPLRLAFRLVGREVSNPLRVTSYCALAVSAFLLNSAVGGSGVALFPGLAGLFFGIGNFIQSGEKITQLRENPQTSRVVKALLHPAVWYGMGYTMTGIGVGGGLSLLADPLQSKTASLLTAIGITETVGALGLMALGKVTNQAAPFVGVACGTLFFAASGLAVGNGLGAATGIFACCGELSLAVLMQKLHNISRDGALEAKLPSKIEDVLTAPIRVAMKRGWIASTPEMG